MNLAFKHLEDRLRIGELTLWQWAWLLIGVLLALAWGLYLSPLGTVATLFSAIYVAGLPALAALFAGLTEFDFLGLIVGAWRWWRRAARHLPGTGEDPDGYLVTDAAGERRETSGRVAPLDLEALWDC